MHGRPRKPSRAEDSTAAVAKASNLRDLQSLLLHNHHHRVYTKEAISASSKLLEINPEIYTAWNYRKLAFQQILQEATGPGHIKTLVNDELRTVEMALSQNPKSYGAWYHRKWILSQGLVDVDFDREFRLLDQLLKVDFRNFHGWNYRRFISKLKGLPEVEELKFTMDMINTNFSNYSAWHTRSTLLSYLLSERSPGFTERESILTKEYELVHQALFTDPRDQSGWFYHLWLLDQTITPNEILLVSSWPSHESDLVVSVNANTAYCKPSRPTSSGYYFMNAGKFPVVLYFNQTVKGVDSSSVTINSVLVKNEDLVWKTLSLTKSQEACCWVTYLQILDGHCSDSNVYLIEVKIDNSEDTISSSNCSQLSNPLYFRFTLSFNDNNLDHAESADGLFNWTDGESHSFDCNDPVSFDRLKLSEDHAPEFSKWRLNTISKEIDLFRELSEENSKFGKLTLARLLVAQETMLLNETPLSERLIHSMDALELFDELMKLDPMHARYYEDEKSLVLMNQVTLDKKSFGSHFSPPSNQSSSNRHLHGCVQLKNLSLTRIANAQRLLWVQVLDLSHNKLRSIEGIEALQLLTCLNLRHNQICSFTALEPLKLLSHFAVLDISFNQIGSHPVDTTRYLFSSPSTESMRIDKNVLEYCRDSSINVLDNWEAVLLFRDLHLKQLDVKNNPAADGKFKGLLMQVLPTLSWLDGEHV